MDDRAAVDSKVVGVLHIRNLDDDLHRAARIEAIENGESLRELVERALRREVTLSRRARRAPNADEFRD
jgi:plasmid stability protein